MNHRMQIATIREVAAFLRLKESTVSSMALHGKLPAVKLGKSWRFDMERIERLFVGRPVGERIDRMEIDKTLKEEVRCDG